MAGQKKKTQAELAAASSGKSTKKNTVDSAKKTSSGKKKDNASLNAAASEKTRKVPARLISSAIFLGMFILTLVVFFLPAGKDAQLVRLIGKLIHGLIGRIGFIISIPA